MTTTHLYQLVELHLLLLESRPRLVPDLVLLRTHLGLQIGLAPLGPPRRLVLRRLLPMRGRGKAAQVGLRLA